MEFDYKTIKLLLNDPFEKVAKIVINRPDKLNAINSEVIKELDLAINEIEYRKKEIWAVIVTGSGDKAFIAGADIAEMVKLSPPEARYFLYSAQQMLNRLENLPMPVIAAINGTALGGGFELALSCDIRIASDKALIGLPEVSLGIIPSAGGTQRLTRLIGDNSKYIIMTGKKFSASEALSIGIVNEVVPHEKFDEVVVSLIKKIISLAPIALSAAKKSIRAALDENLRAGLELELDKAVECFQTKDLREGMTAFLEKRKPEFRGK
jgi:enoyl-CoA hydratase